MERGEKSKGGKAVISQRSLVIGPNTQGRRLPGLPARGLIELIKALSFLANSSAI